MLIKIKNSSDLKDHDVTDLDDYYDRRSFIRSSFKYLTYGALANYGMMFNTSHASFDFTSAKKSTFQLQKN